MTQRAALGEIELPFILEGGPGPRLLLLNGTGASLTATAALRPPFTSRFELLAFDPRGIGDATAPPPPWTMADYAADALALLDHVGWDRCRVVGISFGGMVAQELAVTAPERVERLALLCTSPGGVGGSSYPLDELAALPADERAERLPELADTRFTPEYLATDPVARSLLDLFASGRSAPQTSAQIEGALGQLEARRGHDVCDRLHRITAPTLVAAGRFDGIAPVTNSEAIVARVPNAELRTYDGGHPFILQDGAALPEVIDFLAG